MTPLLLHVISAVRAADMAAGAGEREANVHVLWDAGVRGARERARAWLQHQRGLVGLGRAAVRAAHGAAALLLAQNG